MLVPFERVTEGEQPAQTSQPARARRLQALADAQAMLCAAPGRLGRIEGEKGETSGARAAGTGNKEGEGAQPYVPNWPQVTTESNLSSADEKQEWLLNCVPPGVLEGYEMLGEGSVIGLGVQSSLLVRGVVKVNLS